jgi:phage recombination protein Bet
MSNFKGGVPSGIVLAPAQNQVIQFKDDSGNEIRLSQQDVLQYICPNATPQEVVFFMELCRAQRLNPFIREAFLVKFGNNTTIQTAEIVFERRANAHPDYQGMEHGVVYLDKNGQVQRREGTATYKVLGEQLIGGWCRVHRKGRIDSVAEVSLDEYDKRQSLWKTMPGVMIDKCAKSVALRLAFPSEFEGLYSEAEMGGMPSIQEVHAEVIGDAPESHGEPQEGPSNEMDGLQAELNKAVRELADIRSADVGAVMLSIMKSKTLTNSGFSVGDDMTPQQMRLAIDQAKAWIAKAMEEPVYEEA